MKRIKHIVSKKQLWAVIAFLFIYNEIAFGQITGTVFRDFNGNGTKESAEPLVAGVEVKAYDTAGSQCGTTQTTTAASAPNYSLSGCTGAVRVEFTIPTGTCFADDGIDYAALGGGAHGTSVQFLANTSAGTRTANFALFYPGEYGGEATFVPDLYNVIHRAGNPTPTPAAPSGDASYTANKSAVTSTGYFENGLVITSFAQGGAASIPQRQVGHTTLALAGQVGTLWGNAYSKHAERLFVSAFLRRHAGMGPGGPGAIYIINPASPNLTGNLIFADLDALGFSTHAASGAYNIKSNTARNLVAQPLFSPSTDADAYDQVGKTSLGDLDISENGQFLFITNLFDRKLYRIDLQNPITPQPPTAAQISSYTIPDPCTGVANAGEYRPFGLKVFKGKLYTGVMCSGQDATNNEIGTSATMSLHLLAFDLGTTNTPATPTVVYTQSMAYRDNDAIRGTGATPTVTYSARWRPWKNEFVTTENHPMFTDIEFDNNGNFLLGLTDRNGFQTGGGQYNLSGSGPHTKYYANGDILKITKDATCSLSMATGSYFQNDLYQDQSRWGTPLTGNPYSHAEMTLGGVTSHRFGDRDEVVTTALNPVSFTSNGYVAFNNTNGQQERANELWWDSCNLSTEACMDKAGGLGDLELMSLPAPIEIGNRVWLDTDNDGIQDAGETGISGVTVELVKSGTVISTATTDANGNYYFSSATGTDTASIKYGLTQLMPNMAYTVRFPTTTTVAATTYNLTTAAAGSNRLIDSNAPANGEVTVLATDIPVAGSNNHSFDVGYSSAPVCSINTPTITPTCNDNGTSSNPADDTFTFTISATGTGVGANYKVDKIAPAPTSTVFASVNYGATSAASSSFPISGGNLTLTLTDNTTSTCTLTPVTVTAPPTCSNAAPGQPDLRLVKTASHSSVNSGQTLTYTLTLTNEGTASATGVVVRDVLPTAVSYVTSVASQGSYDNGTGLWTVGTVAVGASLTLTITVTVN